MLKSTRGVGLSLQRGRSRSHGGRPLPLLTLTWPTVSVSYEQDTCHSVVTHAECPLLLLANANFRLVAVLLLIGAKSLWYLLDLHGTNL